MTDDDEILDAVRHALVAAKSEVVTLLPEELGPESRLNEPPINLDSLELIALVTQLEERLGLEATDERFFARSPRTVGDLVDAVRTWVADDGEDGRAWT